MVPQIEASIKLLILGHIFSLLTFAPSHRDENLLLLSFPDVSATLYSQEAIDFIFELQIALIRTDPLMSNILSSQHTTFS